MKRWFMRKDDQARASTPAEALAAGASHLVCGRPVTAAPDPREAALRIVHEMSGLCFKKS